MKQKTFIIHNDSVIESLVTFLKTWDSPEPWEVTVREHKETRSSKQNRLYFKWVGAIADDLGETKEDVHFDLRRRMLCPIYIRDDPGYSEMILALKRVQSLGAEKEVRILGRHIIEETSTTKANVKQFTEYLQEIERDCASKNIPLPYPEDLYNEALMTKPKD